MITFEEAHKKVLERPLDLGNETVGLEESMGRVLAENVLADRDFPPFDRSTKDGISISYSAIEKGIDTFKIEGILSAGMSQQTLSAPKNCMEIMTGAVLPKGADTIIMYEETSIKNGFATILVLPQKGQNIHAKGSDEELGSILLKSGARISSAEIGVLASVGKSKVSVKKVPKVCVVSTGSELVEVAETPLPHQIRKSNTLSLTAALSMQNVVPQKLHVVDDKDLIQNKIESVLNENDVLLLSGGVSKGKFDFIPEVFEALGVEKVFHRVAQRPGKPFWFGVHKEFKTIIFSFPGNPVSTFANYHIYFLPWLNKTLGTECDNKSVILEETVEAHHELALFLLVKVHWYREKAKAHIIKANGSGDLISLAKADGFVCIPPGKKIYKKGDTVVFTATR